jgi:hypothetical protein
MRTHNLLRRSVSELIEEMKRDMLVGVGETGIKKGILGEIGCSRGRDSFITIKWDHGE